MEDWTEEETELAKVIFEKLAMDPDWDDAPLSDDQRVSEDDDPSQMFCLQWARRILLAYEAASFNP